MLLGIDVGNTNTVIGALEGSEVVHLWRVSTQVRTTDELGLTLLSLLVATPGRRLVMLLLPVASHE